MLAVFKNKKQLINTFIKPTDIVLDVGFWGQGITINHEKWAHRLLINRAKDVFGLDMDFDEKKLQKIDNYKKGNAEDFDFDNKFDVIFAADLIEHLSNPGLFLQACFRNLKNGGFLIITTPNCFNLFNLAEKMTKEEPTVNNDHTCYFNYKTLKSLLEKNGLKIKETGYLYSLELGIKESYRKKFLNFVYYVLSKFTDKFMETLIVVIEK